MTAQITRLFVQAFVALVLLLSVHPAPAQQSLSRDEAETRLKALKTEISALQKSIERERENFAREQETLKEADLEVQASALRLRELRAQQAQLDKELDQLESERSAYLESLSERKDQLGQQIVAAYQLGRESRLKLLLNQDSPARLSRMLAYYDYFSRAQIEQIKDLRVALDTLDLMQLEIDKKLLALNQIQENAQQELFELQENRNARKAMVLSLAGQIDSDEGRLNELRQNQQDLESLLDRLSSALADIPTDLGQYINPRKQRGSIPVPVNGRVLHAFGQSRLGGLNWQGWLIEAEAGTEVQTIAYGRVAYADWLRGYGLLMILDHGEGMMSLYGNNESLLYDVGDWVQPGTVISTVGETPGSDQGLYFELRDQGKAVDPASWLDR